MILRVVHVVCFMLFQVVWVDFSLVKGGGWILRQVFGCSLLGERGETGKGDFSEFL